MQHEYALPGNLQVSVSAQPDNVVKPLDTVDLHWQHADDPLLKWALVSARLVTDADNATFAAIERASGHAVIVASASESRQELWRTRFSLDEGVAGRVVATNQPLLVNQTSESPVFRKIGSRPIQSILAVPVEADGQSLGVLTVTSARVDAFKRDAAETLQAVSGQLSAALKLARQYSGLAQLRELAHDLNSPLSALRGFVRLALNDSAALSAIQREYLELAAVAADQLVHLASDIHDVMYLSSGSLPIRLRDVDPVELARTVVNVCIPLASEAGVRIDFLSATNVHHLHADRRRIERVLSNLIHNAIKFAPSNSVITVRVHVQLGDEMCFTVEDEGPGISEAEAQHLFDYGYQGDIAPPRAAEGHGLGLSIASALASAHGGRISVENRATGGARSSLYLPICPPESRPHSHSFGSPQREIDVV